MVLKPYKTVKQASLTEVIINKSRFIGRAYPVTSEEEALTILTGIRKKHYDATHNCFAYVIKDSAARFSDDGEPSGTAGMPIMDVLKNKELVNTLIIVTRYFGGILLGAGGLVRAYSRSAADAVAAADPILVTPGAKMRIVTDYGRFNTIEAFIRENTFVENITYMEKITVDCIIKTDRVEQFISDMTEKSDGRIVPEILGEEYMQISESAK